ncbi:hypothetical protein ILUMI_05165 [Ignelater luminosus]|uniref:TBC domain-containing protein kinase-like protein n=1 Tax=Ignelater luminosus TaxID=2038154 RepID=A0A8K0D7L6_IGNLU|nr:hypothetical protein ILUMI_05165 [Ignelater luminosus]
MGELQQNLTQYCFSETSRMLLQHREMQFGAITFFAKEHKGETCGSNGLPLTPNSIIIFGRAQLLKTIKHPYLCEYLDIIRGKHERTIVVSQYCGEPLSHYLAKNELSIEDIKRIAHQILLGLNELHDRNIVHRNLSTDNVLLQENKDVKLFNYGLFYMTDHGKLVSFPILKTLYAAPEVYLDGLNNLSNSKADMWSLGIILTELVLDKPLWNTLKLSQCIRKILSLMHGTTSIFERIIREHNCYEKYQLLPPDLKQLIEDCLNILPKNRPTTKQLLERDIFKEFQNGKTNSKNKIYQTFDTFTLKELYYWWQLAGGDVFLELKKQGLIRSSPPVLSLPNMILIEGAVLGQERNPATLYEPRIVQMPLDTLYQRFAHIPLSSYYPLIHSKSEIIEKFEPPSYDASDLPLVIREKDPEYQFHRTILFRRLLHGYPFTRNRIIKEAQVDIPPLLRGEIWAALLNIANNYEKEYVEIDKQTSTITDRQIEVDIPRCHQYNELLSSGVGHQKLKRILKAWICKNSQYVYWQGLDSLTAPFLYLNFNNEAKAFACLSAFIPKYLHNFFLKDNSVIIQEYLAKFSQLIAFHDPVLANHLQNINFVPELFAIPWFLTMFSHVFPLHKIFHLWDKLLLGDSSFPLHVGLSILTQLRDTLLNSGFNECILLFSDLPEVDIEQCVCQSLETYNSTPKSITSRSHQNAENASELHITGITVQELNREKCSRISANDVVNLVRNFPHKIVIIDIRNPLQFSRCCVKGSVNIPCSSVTFGDANLDSFGVHSGLLKNAQNKIIIIVGTEETDLELFPKFLLQCNIPKVCVLHGGFNVLLPITPTVLITQNQI